MTTSAHELVSHFEAVNRDRMQGLPIINPRLEVEAVGFRALEEHELGILITPWFMNLILLPGTGEWRDVDQGAAVERSLPGGVFEFTFCRDDDLGDYLSAVLFRSVADFPDQVTARAIAVEILSRLFTTPDAAAHEAHRNPLSRRALLTGSGATEQPDA